MAPDWEATVEAQAAELKPLIANKTVVGLCVRISPTNEANCVPDGRVAGLSAMRWFATGFL